MRRVPIGLALGLPLLAMVAAAVLVGAAVTDSWWWGSAVAAAGLFVYSLACFAIVLWARRHPERAMSFVSAWGAAMAFRSGGTMRPRIPATVEWWSDEEGWGALAGLAEAPGGVFVHFSVIQMDEYKTLRPGQKVEARIEGPLPFDQDGYRYRATAVWPLNDRDEIRSDKAANPHGQGYSASRRGGGTGQTRPT